MATYKPIRKTANGTEEIKIPYAVLADAPDLSKFVKTNTANTFTETQGIADGKHLKTNLIKSADDSKRIAEITAAGLEIGGSGTPLRFYSNTRPVVANQNKELAYTSDIPAAVTESTVSGWGFTKNTGTVTSVAVKMNGATKGTVTSSGTIDLGTVITSHQDISGKANLAGGNTFTGKQTLTDAASDGYSINASGYIKGSWLQASSTANKGSNTGKVCVFDGNGWIYYRTPSEILSEASGVPKSAFSLTGTTLTITI